MYKKQDPETSSARYFFSSITAAFLLLIMSSMVSPSINANPFLSQKALAQLSSQPQHPLLSVSKGPITTPAVAAAPNKNNTLTYENSTYGIKISYPSDWSYQELPGFSNSSFIDIVQINPPIAADPNALTSLDVNVQNNISPKLALDQHARNVIAFFKGANYTNFKLVSAKTDSNLARNPAYSIVFTYTDTDGLAKKLMERGAIIGGYLYSIDFNTETSKYRSFLPTVENIMDSLSVTPQNQSSVSS